MNTVRVSILTIPAEHLESVAQLMVDAEESLSAIKQLPGLVAYFAGVDRATMQLSNVSVWDSTDHANAMTTFQPMLDLAKRCMEFPGVTFLRPIPNFDSLWQWEIK
jgi:hypothetical protein